MILNKTVKLKKCFFVFWFFWLRRCRRALSPGGGGGQVEGVVDTHQLLHAVLLQHHHIIQTGAPLSSTVLTVNHVRLPAAGLTCHKQQVKHLHITLVAVVGRLVLHSALIGDLPPVRHQLVPQDLDVLHGLEQAVFDHLVGVWVSDLQTASHVPRHMNHGDNRLDLLHFIPLESLQS